LPQGDIVKLRQDLIDREAQMNARNQQIISQAQTHMQQLQFNEAVQILGTIAQEYQTFTTTGLSQQAGATVTISSIPVRAIKPGRIVFGIGEADIIPLHEALLFGNQDSIPSADIRFGSALLEILGDGAEGAYVAAVDAVYESMEQFN
jgi:hypothetical protein